MPTPQERAERSTSLRAKPRAGGTVRELPAALFHALDGRLFRDGLYLRLKAAALRLRGEDPTPPGRVLELSRRPVVIGGCGRSGTTLALSVLSSHPHVHAFNEETGAFCPLPDSGMTFSRGALRVRRIYYLLLRSNVPDECRRWCEKSPRNVHYVDRILRCLGPGCRFIHMVRDGRDVITSRHPLDPHSYWVSKDRWVADVRAGLRFRDHPQVLTVRYEDLVSKYEETVRSICSFLDEPFHSAMLRYPETAKIRSNTAWFGPAESVHHRSVERWRRQEHRRLIDELMADPVAVGLLRKLAYLDDD